VAERDEEKDRPEPRGFSRRIFLAGGAALTGGVIWGAADAASAGASTHNRPQWEGWTPPHIPGGTGNTGNTGSGGPPSDDLSIFEEFWSLFPKF
jgi:hypothetical protein